MKLLKMLSAILITITVGFLATTNASKAESAPSVFKDVSASNSLYPSIYNLYAKQAISGYYTNYGELLYKPYQPVTRAQAAKIIALTLGLDTENAAELDYKDVSKSAWYYKPLAALVEAGYMSGYTDGTIRPNDTLTRAQMAKIISLSFQYDIKSKVTLNFKDVPKDKWHAPYIQALVENNVTKGTSATTFSPDDKVTRQQIAAFVDRAYSKVPTSEYNEKEVFNLFTELEVKIDNIVQYYKNEGRPAFNTIQNQVKQYATSPEVSYIKEYYETSCTQCDHMLYDIPMDYNLYFDLLEHTNNKIVFETAYPENEMDGGHFAEITLLKENGKFKLAEYYAWSFDDKPLNISLEEATKYVKSNANVWDETINSIKYSYTDYKGIYHYDVYTNKSYYDFKFNPDTGYLSHW
jgi:hypothetical protein